MKTVLITGATAGIGKVTAKELARGDYEIIIVGRNKEKTIQCVDEIKKETTNPHVHFLLADLSNPEDAKKLAGEFNEQYENLHILINNAGAVYQKRELTKEGFEKTMVTNHLSHFILTNLLLDKIKKSAPARIINISSIAHFDGRWLPDNIHLEKKYTTLRAYSNSKLHNILFTKYLAENLKNEQVTVNCLHPGVVKTKIGNKNTSWLLGFLWGTFASIRGISDKEGAKTILYLATSPDVSHITGKYFDKCKEVSSSEISNNFAAAEKLWNMSLEMAGMRPG